METLRHRRVRHEKLDVLVLELGEVESPDARDELLTDGIHRVIAEVVGTSRGAGTGLAIELRAPENLSVTAAANVEAFVSAVHGLVHSYVAEERAGVVPVNLVVSGPAQAHDRNATLDYLAAPDGQFARGAAFDLRDAS